MMRLIWQDQTGAGGGARDASRRTSQGIIGLFVPLRMSAGIVRIYSLKGISSPLHGRRAVQHTRTSSLAACSSRSTSQRISIH
jgi:hypothetical protein